MLSDIFNKEHENIIKMKNETTLSLVRYHFYTINKIDEIKVKCYIVSRLLYQNKKIVKHILSMQIDTNIYDCEVKEYNNIYFSYLIVSECSKIENEDVSNSLVKMNEILPKLRYNRYVSLLDQNYVCEPFDSKYIDEDNCCIVCLDYTNIKSSCGHKICLQCWSKITKLVCPYCRHNNLEFETANTY